MWLTGVRGSRQIALVDAISGAREIVREISQGEPLGLSLSPDGRRVAYDLPLSTDPRARVLHVVDRDSGDDRVLFPDQAGNDRFPLWTPDGRRLFFISDRSGSTDGWTVPVDAAGIAGSPSLVVRNLARVTSLGLSAAGTFYYRLQAGAFEVNEIALDSASGELSSPPRTVPSRFTASNIGPSYSADGHQMAYISIRDGLGGTPNRLIVIKDLDTGAERELAPTDPVGNSPARWSPDGRRLLQGSRILDVRTGAVLQQFNQHAEKDQSSFGPTRWGPDGKSVVYEQEQKGLVKHVLDGGPDTIVYAYSPERPVARIHRFEISPDGGHLAFSAGLRDGSESVLEVIGGDRELELTRRTFPENVIMQGWSKDSQYVFFTTFRAGTPGPHELWRASIWGSAPQRLGTIDGATHINPVAFSPTGSALAYTSGTPLHELWAMDHFLPAR
jgi:Tol biopolymer transport system component